MGETKKRLSQVLSEELGRFCSTELEKLEVVERIKAGDVPPAVADAITRDAEFRSLPVAKIREIAAAYVLANVGVKVEAA